MSRFLQSIANSGLHWLFFAIGQRQISWIEKCKGPPRRKRNRQSEADARVDVEECRGIVVETTREPWNFDAGRVYKLATITGGSWKKSQRWNSGWQWCKRKYSAPNASTGYQRRYRIGFRRRISCEIFQSFVGRHNKTEPDDASTQNGFAALNFTASSITHSWNVESRITFRIANNGEKVIFAD